MRPSSASTSAAEMPWPLSARVKSSSTPSDDAPLERDRLRPAGIGDDVLAGVAVGAHVVVLNDQAVGGQRTDAVLGRADPLGELLVGLEHAIAGGGTRGKVEHVRVDRHREVDDAPHRGVPVQ